MTGFVIFDHSWNRLVRWCEGSAGQPPALYCAHTKSKTGGPTLFSTRQEARKAIRETKKVKPYAWATNDYAIYEVHQ